MKVVEMPNADQLTAAVEKLRRDLPKLREYLKIMASLQKTKYDYLREEGFTDDQALELSKTIIQG